MKPDKPRAGGVWGESSDPSYTSAGVLGTLYKNLQWAEPHQAESLPAFLPRDAMYKRGLCRRSVYVGLGDCLSRLRVVSKQLKIWP